MDTDFSEITDSNIQKNGLNNIIGSTVSSGYGRTYYVIKKGDYDEDKSYIGGTDERKTRYIRTAIGSNKISYIITSEWDEEYGYIMAQNGRYIPVIDLNTQKELFTVEQYDAIREKMKGLSFYRAENFEVDESAFNPKVLKIAEEMKKQAKGKKSTEEKREKIVQLMKDNLPKIVVEEMVGDLSSQIVEFIDTGSTGRGTNIPGDGDFDFMLKCSSMQEQVDMIKQIKSFLNGNPKGGDNEYNIRYENVKIKGLDETVDIDVTSEKKSLETEYSSDLCIRDRLEHIERNYDSTVLQNVVDNIIVAKKKLKELGTYKKTGSDKATENGGFGGIGVENWILQNGGSYILAMETFLDTAKETENFEEFNKRYPIYDFGQNHRTGIRKGEHDHYIEGLSAKGFETLQEAFIKELKEYGIEYEYSKEGHPINSIEFQNKQEILQEDKIQEEVVQDVIQNENEEKKASFFDSVIGEITSNVQYKVSDFTRIKGYLARLKAKAQIKNQEEPLLY